MSLNTTELRQKREALTATMTDAVAQEQKYRSANEIAKADEYAQKFEAAETEHRSLTEQINRFERLKQVEADAAGQFADQEDRAGKKDTSKEREARYKEAFMTFFREGTNALTPEHRSILGTPQYEQRANTAGTNSAGGFLIPQDFLPELTLAMKSFSGMLQAARYVPTSSGAALPWPTNDRTARKATIVGEGVTRTATDFVFGQKTLNAFTYSDMATVSIELMQDSYFDLGLFINDSFAESFGRGTNEHFTTGTDSGQPNGCLTASVAGKTAASATAFTRSEIVDLIHSVDPAYRSGPKTGLMMNDAVLAAIKKLALGSNDASPLWQQSMRDGEPDKIEGFQYWINQDMPSALTTGQKLIMFGDFNYYIIRQVMAMSVRRLEERFIDQGLIGFIGFARFDGELANTSAVKHLKLA